MCVLFNRFYIVFHSMNDDQKSLELHTCPMISIFKILFVNKVNCFQSEYDSTVYFIYDWTRLFFSLFHFCLLNSSNRLLLLTHCPWVERESEFYIRLLWLPVVVVARTTTASQKLPFFIRGVSFYLIVCNLFSFLFFLFHISIKVHAMQFIDCHLWITTYELRTLSQENVNDFDAVFFSSTEIEQRKSRACQACTSRAHGQY